MILDKLKADIQGFLKIEGTGTDIFCDSLSDFTSLEGPSSRVLDGANGAGQGLNGSIAQGNSWFSAGVSSNR